LPAQSILKYSKPQAGTLSVERFDKLLPPSLFQGDQTVAQAQFDIAVTIKGLSPLLFHSFHTEGAPGRQGDQDPRAIAEKHLYLAPSPNVEGDPNAEEIVFLPGKNLFACLVGAGKFQKLGKNKMTTLKESIVPAYVGVAELVIPVYGRDGQIVTKSTGWEVDTAPVVNPSTGGRIIAHRPRVDVWSASFTLQIYEPKTYGESLARELVDHAGTKVGLLSFRPSRKGPYGKFRVDRWKKEAGLAVA
jgi:hypothetical protein